MLRFLKQLFIITALIAISACDNQPVEEQALQSPTGYSDVDSVKLSVGQAAPLFSLQALNGDKVSLSSFRDKKGVMLVFYRGYWCPFCIGHLEDIQTLLPTLAKQNVQLLAISPDDASGLQRMAENLDKDYLFLSDPDLATIEQYGIRRDEKLPHPAVVLIDTQGIVQWFYVGENYKQRPSASQLEQVLARLAK